jgi:phosphatidylserine decarboxylase
VLVASIRLHRVDVTLDRRYRGARRIAWNAAFERGEEMGYFQHGSTIIVLAGEGMALHESLRAGRIIRMGEPLLRKAARDAAPWGGQARQAVDDGALERSCMRGG